jgi:YidC/Oxa1 family membrane protein insertase
VDEQKRLLVALGLIALVVVVMTYFWPSTPPRREPADRPAQTEQVAQSDAGSDEPGESPAAAGPSQPRRELAPEKHLTLRTPKLAVEVTTRGGGLLKAELLDERFRDGQDDEAHQIDLVSADVAERADLMPMAFQLVSKNHVVPSSDQTAEAQGVIRMLNHGEVTGEWLQSHAGLDAATATGLVRARPLTSLDAVRTAISGNESSQRQTVGKLLATAWREGFVALDFEVLETDDEQRIVLRGLTQELVQVRRTIETAGEYEVRVRDELVNQGSRILQVRERLVTTGLEKRSGGSGCFSRPTGLLRGLCLHGDDIVSRNRDRLAGESSGCMGLDCGGSPGPESRSGEIRFVAVDHHFFMSALSPSHAADGGWGETTCDLTAELDGELEVSIEPVVFTELPPGARAVYVATMYLGPKQFDLLESVGPGRRLWEAIDYGWFAPLAHLLLRALRLFHGWLGNWGLAIILLTFIIKTLLLPVSHKTFKSMRKMQAEIAQIKPEIDEINEKFKDDYEVRQRKTLELYNKHGISPLKQAAGCLPMFLQMPIWIALYRMISESVELYRAPFYLWIHDLSAQDPYYILPGLLGVAMYVQQAITPSPGMDNQQQKMMKWMMPGMFLLIMINMPTGLVLYIFVNTLLTIVQQQFINRTIPAVAPAHGVAGSGSKAARDPSAARDDEPDDAKGRGRTKVKKAKSQTRK